MSDEWVKESEESKVWWLDNFEINGEMIFSFDKKQKFWLFKDYPTKLTKEQKVIFDKENPEWAKFFGG